MAKQKSLDLGDENQVKERKTKIQLRRERQSEELKQVLETPHGRAVIWRFLSYCGMYHDAPVDPDAAARFNGRRSIGIKILEDVFEANENVYVMMMRESEEYKK